MLIAQPMINNAFSSYLLASIPPGIMLRARARNPIENTMPTSLGEAWRSRRYSARCSCRVPGRRSRGIARERGAVSL